MEVDNKDRILKESRQLLMILLRLKAIQIKIILENKVIVFLMMY